MQARCWRVLKEHTARNLLSELLQHSWSYDQRQGFQLFIIDITTRDKSHWIIIGKPLPLISQKHLIYDDLKILLPGFKRGSKLSAVINVILTNHKVCTSLCLTRL